MTSFTDLATEFLANTTLQEIWGYRMPGGPPDAYTYTINRTACEALRGYGSDYYPWATAANTIATWVLPFTGLLLQAPFDSNDAIGTFWAIARWTGGSMASLSAVLWNVRISANCAAFLDKATRRNDFPPAEVEDEKGNKKRSDYASYRDACFLLSVMNQFTINTRFNGASAEKLLKVALFSQQLHMPITAGGSLEDLRQALARDTREARKRGTVQCFLSMLWFVFGMVISIQQSFGLLGQTAPAENLALGLAMVWFPVLILCTVVDRNPAISEATQRQLNTFLGLVRDALLRDAGRYREEHQIFRFRSRATSFAAAITGVPFKIGATFKEIRESPASNHSGDTEIEQTGHGNWFDSIECDSRDMRWLDEISDPALDDAEFFNHFAGQGRRLFHYGVAWPMIEGLKRDKVIDARRGWSYSSNCRAKLISTANWEMKDRIHSWDHREWWQNFISLFIVWTSMLGAFLISYFTPTVGLGCRSLGYMVYSVVCTGLSIIEMSIWALTPHSKAGTVMYDRLRFYGVWFIRVAELCNMIWLLYIIFAQALGSYNTCACQVAGYGIGGGYINLNIVLVNGPPNVARKFWIAATTLGCAVLAGSFSMIVWEWVTQSHMSSEEYENAMKGLKLTRRFKKYTKFIFPFQA